MIKKLFSLATILIVAILVLTTTKSTNAAAVGQVDICHATAANNNPYVSEHPNIQNDGSLSGGHLNHTGPVFPTANWGDIIPPYTFYTCPNGYQLNGINCTKNNQPNIPATQGNYPGMNWTAQGQAILNNGCNIPAINNQTHHECSNLQCTVVNGAGADTCTTDADCQNPTHHSCNNSNQCVVVNGGGVDTCTTDADCAAPNNPGNPGNPGGGNPGNPGPSVCNAGKPGTTSLISVVINGPDSVKLSWTAVAGANDYIIEYGIKSNSYIYGVPSTGNVTSYVIGSLDLSKTYFFRVIAVNGCAQGDPSNEVQTAFGGPVLGLSNTSSSDNSIIFLVGAIIFLTSGIGMLVRNVQK